MKKTKTKKMTAEQKRKARNEYSRKWKAEHKVKVAKWNADWQKAQKKAKKASKKKAVRKPQPRPQEATVAA